MKHIFILLLTFIIFSCATGPESLLRRAIKDEQKQKYDLAEQKYLTIVVKYPSSEYVSEAKYRLGLIYKDIKKDYVQARMWFSDIIINHKDSNFYTLAEVGMLESPDYTGILDGNKVILGDIESGGKNMRIETVIKKIDVNLYSSISQLYAGDKLVRKVEKFYLKTDQQVREYSSNPSIDKNLKYTVIFKLPAETGNQWKTEKENRTVIYTIVATGLQLKLKNFAFEDCIKILERYENETGIRYLYYAPNKGCVKITTSSLNNPTREFPVIELIQ